MGPSREPGCGSPFSKNMVNIWVPGTEQGAGNTLGRKTDTHMYFTSDLFT